ncbi:hypothetical protein KKC88_04185 [Patescibacteria group bacterium]|nr:hypothetical protein [Patescibacteria group bacterium]MBU1673168.1 hypothetical protein [Patescibacteria group bacterium]MBU1964147.1 hypothetical protein [Patescibacteria group bacterium]
MQYTAEQLKKYDLRDEAYAEYIKAKFDEAILHESSADALDMADLIDQWYKAHPDEKIAAPEVFDWYIEMKWPLCWMALNILDDNRVIQLYSGHINDLRKMLDKFPVLKEEEGFQHYFMEKLREKLQTMLIFEDRDALKTKIKDVLMRNEEPLFDVPLEIEGQKVKSTIGNWINFYNAHVGTGELDKLKQTEFFSKDKIFISLNNNQQKILQAIFNTYEQIKISSYEEQGIETEVDFKDDKGMGTLIYGKLERYDPKTEKEFDEFVGWYEKETGEKLQRDPKAAPPAGISMPAPGVASVATEEYLPVSMADAEDTPKPQRLDTVDAVYSGLTKSKAEVDASKINLKVADPDAVIAALIQENKMEFSSPEAEERFTNLCRTFLRGVRSDDALIAALTRPDKNGGMNYDINKATAIRDLIVELSKDPKYQVLPEKMEAEPIEENKDMPTFAQVQGKIKTAASATPKGVITLEPIPKKKPAPKPKSTPKKAPPKKEYMPVAAAAPTKPLLRSSKSEVEGRSRAEAPAPPETPPKIDIKPPAPKPKPASPIKATPTAKPVPKKAVKKAGPAPMPRLRRMASTDRPMVTDVKTPAPMVMGPIDELQNMDLVEFRTLGADPEQGSESMLEKVNLLLEQGVTEKSKGIQAWKKSPLNKEYLEIGQKSMDKDISVEEYIAEQNKINPNAMTLEEFDAIADLNKNLRF